MNASKQLIIPILIIALGITWLLNVMDLLPGIDWIWTIGLAVIGILVLAFGGSNKLSLVVGPFLLIGSICSILRQTGKLPINYEVPILVIALGVLLLIVQCLNVPNPEFVAHATEKE